MKTKTNQLQSHRGSFDSCWTDKRRRLFFLERILNKQRFERVKIYLNGQWQPFERLNIFSTARTT